MYAPRTLLTFLLLSLSPSVYADWTVNNGVVTQNTGTETWTHNPSISFDAEAFTGSLSYTNSNPAEEWVYDASFSPSYTPGAWAWRVGDNEWTYQPSTQGWSLNGEKALWYSASLDVTLFLNVINHYVMGKSIWERSIRSNDELQEPNESWKHLADYQGANYGQAWKHAFGHEANSTLLEEIWGFDRRENYWLLESYDTRWVFNTQALEWTSPDSSDIWGVDPRLETFEYKNQGAPRNRWRFVALNKWVEEESGIEWLYKRAVDENSVLTLTWENTSTNETWDYDDVAGTWKKTGTQTTKKLPFWFPPLVVLQANIITDAYNGATGALTDSRTPVTGEYTWTAAGSTLRSHTDGALKLSSSSSSIHMGRGSRYGYAGEDFETTTGEKWHLQDTFPNGGSVYQNVSTGIAHPDTARYSAARSMWWRSDISSEYRWQYDVVDNVWINTITGARYRFNLDEFTWQSIADSQHLWRYYYNGSLWVWKNLQTNEEWAYVSHTVDNEQINVWKNIDTDIKWKLTISEGHTAVFSNVDGGADWIYNPETDLCEASPGVDQNIFPLLPPTIAGFIAALKYIASQDTTTSTSPTGQTPGLKARISESKTAVDTLATQAQAIIESREGLALYDEIAPLIPTMRAQGIKNKNILNEYSQLVHPFDGDEWFRPAQNAFFAQWSPTNWRLSSPGKGAFVFELTELFGGCLIGFAPEPTSDGSATYYLEVSCRQMQFPVFGGNPPVQIGINFHTTYRVKLYKDFNLLHSADHFLEEYTQASNVKNLWCTIENGHIVVGVGQPFDAYFSTNGAGGFFNYQITGDPTVNTLSYYSIGSLFNSAGYTSLYSNNTLFYTDLVKTRSFDFECASTQIKAVNSFNRYQDVSDGAILEKDWAASKVTLNNVAATRTTYRETQAAAEQVINETNAQNAGMRVYKMYLQALSSDSVPHLVDLEEEFSFITGTLKAYFIYVNILTLLEDSLTAILSADPSSLTVAEQEALIAESNTAIQIVISQAQTNLFGLTLAIGDILALPQNSNLAPYVAFLEEESALLQNLAVGFSTASPAILERFAQQANLLGSLGGNVETSLSTEQYEKNKADNQRYLLTLLSQRVIQRQSTPFAALTAAAMIIFINNKFDSIREAINTYLTANNYTNFHALLNDSSPLNDPDLLVSTLGSILNNLAPTLNLNGSTFYQKFLGATQTPNEYSETAYIHTNIPGSEQQTSVRSGSEARPANTSINTGTDGAIINTVREVLVSQNDKTAAHSRLYVKDAIVALGNGNFNSNSGNALSLFGAAEISPEGNAVITLNSDIIISGANFLRPSTTFGTDPTDPTRCVPTTPAAERGVHEIVFYSPVERTITVTSSTDLDLTSFAQGLTKNGQRIVFGGKIKVVFEPNTRLRLPYTAPNEFEYGLNIVFKDDSQLIFQGVENYDMPTFTNPLTGPDTIRTKILGCGTLELQGNARAFIMNSALASVEADYTSNVTNIHLVLKDHSRWYIGDEATAGGGFQIGNVVDGGFNNLDIDNYPNTKLHSRFGDQNNPFTPHPSHIDFNLTLDGSDAQFYIGKQGFFGVGVGTVQKAGIINGGGSQSPWTLHSLYNVGNIGLTFLKGTFWHQNCATGDSPEASLFAISDLTARALYTLTLNKNNPAPIKGGGNVLFMRKGVTTPLAVEILSTVVPLSGDETTRAPAGVQRGGAPPEDETPSLPTVPEGNPADNGKHSILAPAQVIMLRQTSSSVAPAAKKYGRGTIAESDDMYQFSAPLDEFYLAITFQKLNYNGKYVLSYLKNGENFITFVDGDGLIVTNPVKKRVVKDQTRKKVTTQNLASKGILRALTLNSNPKSFVKPR